ncbi:MAG: hypothetical protein BRD24_05720 [Halobacteriales archaeon SW_9_67_24]|nr:MAG: hypothetical protein BRD24_05720 [Halobacteriales archaeon SW_9_67_24]
MVVSSEPVWGEAVENFVRECDDAIVYGDMEQESILHEGEKGARASAVLCGRGNASSATASEAAG